MAARTGSDPLELPPLFDTIDLDALEASLDSGAHGALSFQYVGYEVTVHSDETVTVCDESPSGTKETGGPIDD